MSLIFDVVLIVICAMTIFMGAKRGFIKSVMHLGVNLVSLIASYAFYPKLAVYLKENYLQKWLTDTIAASIKSLSSQGAGENTVTYNLSKLFADMPDPFLQILNRYHADIASLQGAYGDASEVAESTVDALASSISATVSDVLANVAAYAILFVGCMIALTLLTWILDLIFKLPVLRMANTALGLLFGVICAAVLAWLISVLAVSFIEAMASVRPETFHQSIIENSILLKFFSENNLLALAAEWLG